MFLEKAGIQKIKDSALYLLENVGLRLCLLEAAELLKNAGCSVSGDLVKIPRSLVESAIASTPHEWTIFDKSGKARLFVGQGRTYYGTADVATEHLDYKTNIKRPFVLDDTKKAAKLINHLENIDFACPFGTPMDVPADQATEISFKTLLEITDKPIAFVAHNVDNLKKTYQIAAEQVGGMDNLIEKPYLFPLLEPTSPFVFSPETLKKILWISSHKLPFLFNSAVSLGATAPVTIAGALAECLAEEFGALVVAQVNQPGSPVGLGASFGSFDMKYANYCTGTPEYILANAGFVEVIRSMNIPTWTNGTQTIAKTVDEQASAEAFISSYMPALVGADIVYDAGYLESGLISSLEMVVLCDEMIAYTRRLQRGIAVSEETLAVEVIAEVGPGGNFLAEEHTFENYKSELWSPELMDYSAYDNWQSRGGKTMRERIADKIDRILGV